MKTLLRWLGKIIGSALTLVLVFVLYPYISNLAERLLPDESGAAIKTSAIISAQLEESARLETLKVSEEGVLHYDIQAAFIGSVADINVKYQYNGSFGIDLRKVQMQISGNEITFQLPAPEIMQDSLTPLSSYRNDFWYPGFSDDDYTKLLEDERLSRRETHLTGENGEHLREVSQRVFENTIANWIERVNGNVVFRFERLNETNMVKESP